MMKSKNRKVAGNDSHAQDFDRLMQSISAQFEVSAGNADQVNSNCVELRNLLVIPLEESEIEALARLSNLLAKRGGRLAHILFEFLSDIACKCVDPWRIFEGLLLAREVSIVRRAMDLMHHLAVTSKLKIDREVLRFLAKHVENEDSALNSVDSFKQIRELFDRLNEVSDNPETDKATQIYLNDSDMLLRRLAARLLDIDQRPVSLNLTMQMMASSAAKFLDRYFNFTRATHLDILNLLPELGATPYLLDQMREAESVCGTALLQELISELGWPRLNAGLRICQYHCINIKGSLPLYLTDTESLIFRDCEDAMESHTVYLATAQGIALVLGFGGSEQKGAVEKFRSLNMHHAEVLEEILDINPLTCERIKHILELMDKIVDAYESLFAEFCDECTILQDVYGTIKKQILSEMEKDAESIESSPELTRLVGMFEEISSLGEVRTLHGLKRYLHQRGLQLGFRLVETSKVPNRRISLAFARQDKVEHTVKNIHFTDFDSESVHPDPRRMPMAVELLIDGISRQLLYGQRKFPDIKIFCYGSEVHYYITFRNHPVFLRIDYSPPLRGGMIDLQYFGVSKFELSEHPDISLGAIRQLLGKFDFEVSIDDTHIHARCDKERILDLGKLCDSARALFHLIPYLMDLDWTIGSLALDLHARSEIAKAWADSFVDWGVLPLDRLLTQDHCGILREIDPHLSSPHEVRWSGEGEYHDRFMEPPSSMLIGQLKLTLDKLGLDSYSFTQEGYGRSLGYARLQKNLFRSLCDAIARGEILKIGNSLRLASTDSFRREHEAERFASILHTGVRAVADSISVAWLISPLERTLEFQTTGSLEGYDVQRTRLIIKGETISLFVLRDADQNIRLAVFAHGTVLYSRRGKDEEEWHSNAQQNYSELERMLRSNNYLASSYQISFPEAKAEAKSFLENWKSGKRAAKAHLLEGEQVLHGLKASPGRACGRAVIGIENRTPPDVDDAVLVLQTISPKQNAYVYRSAGVVSTGGAILSHAGLTAIQFKKPAMIISGNWTEDRGTNTVLRCPAIDYKERLIHVYGYEAVIRYGIRNLEYIIENGDLIVLDANQSTLHILGQERDTIALHEGIRQLATTRRELKKVVNDREALMVRGERLHVRNAVEKLLKKLSDPILAKHILIECVISVTQASQDEDHADSILLLTHMMENPQVNEIAKETIVQATGDLELRYNMALEDAMRLFPVTNRLSDILSLRLEIHGIFWSLSRISALLQACRISYSMARIESPELIDRLAHDRIVELKKEQSKQLDLITNDKRVASELRHTLHYHEKLSRILGDQNERDAVQKYIRLLDDNDKEQIARHSHKRILFARDCGFELAQTIGWKAANLAEVIRLCGSEMVPPWFVVTDKCFRDALSMPLSEIAPQHVEKNVKDETLQEGIDAIIAQQNRTNEQKSRMVQTLWDSIVLPEQIEREIIEAYQHICGDSVGGDSGCLGLSEMVAVRSSGQEEDVECNVRAGEFETFLFIRGADSLISFIKRTWGSFWTARAIHSRVLLGTESVRVGGGVVVQKIIQSRVSGVLLTVNVPDRTMSEMVINVGLGMGEGIVSGKVATDKIVINKDRFTKRDRHSFRYTTNDKREQVVFDRVSGQGTKLADTIYHQRQRPALEYAELRQLVDTAIRLEKSYHHPLDIEFAFEGTRLWVLQVRPVPSYQSDIRETIQYYPFSDQIK